MILSKYFVWFIVYSFGGWVFETIYCTINTGKWDNRGFLYGPVCPIYGAGGVAITAVAQLIAPAASHTQPVWWHVFLIAFFGSMVLEYVTSWALEKLFHAYWWDYSNMPLNINGRICLPASLLFGLAGLLIIYVIAPPLTNTTSQVPPLAIEGISLVCMALVSMDATLTVSALTSFEYQVADMEETLNRHMEQFISDVQERTQDMGRRLLDERERFSVQSMESAVRHMGVLHRSALRRVHGFRPRRNADDKEQRNRFLAVLKSMRKS